MKHGNFVGQDWLEITLAEAQKIAEQIMSEIKGVFGNTELFDAPNVEVNNDGMVKNAYITIPFKNKEQFRNVFGARVTPTNLTFFITKDSGYLELKDKDGNIIGKDWKNAPKFSYGCSYDNRSKYIRYRGHRNCGFPWHGYTYGTEIEDLKLDTEKWNLLKDYMTEQGKIRMEERRFYW